MVKKLILILVVWSCFSQSVFAVEKLPYITYNYNYRQDIVYTPAAYVPDGHISGLAAGVGDFKSPQGLCADEDGFVYVADTGNNRVVILAPNMNRTVDIIAEFDNGGRGDKLNAPTGVYVSASGKLYVADTNNKRVIAFSNDFTKPREVVQVIENPKSDILGDGFSFAPMKIAVDDADRVYCISRGAFQGLLLFESTGEFVGYYGTINVNISVREKFWRFVATKREAKNQQLFIPTEFTGIDVDSDGFVYASHLPTNTRGISPQSVRRLNPRGEDIIKKGINGNLGGDLQLGSGPSNFVDICVRGKGIYSVIDSRRGRVFTYDSEGNLLYIFGGLGSQAGTFKIPVAIAEQTGRFEERLLILDSARAEIEVFRPTEYGRLINEAVALRYDGNEELAITRWRNVLKYNENFELANTGIGKSYLSAGDNKQAMHYLRLGMSREYYSTAFRRYRNELLESSMAMIFTAAIGLILFLAVRRALHPKQEDEFDTWSE
ncbi:hypothetical protein AGMMS49975_25230 [Clostridia bacterium]|nr:hypothetical protein AGMMS49975_25230 [Clostridia bacterium]